SRRNHTHHILSSPVRCPTFTSSTKRRQRPTLQDEAQHCHLPHHPDPVHPHRAHCVSHLLPPDTDGGGRDSKHGERHDVCCV
ncbi:hypothetical protein N0V95_007441, partial [Ascochyta clinopodiicola]